MWKMAPWPWRQNATPRQDLDIAPRGERVGAARWGDHLRFCSPRLATCQPKPSVLPFIHIVNYTISGIHSSLLAPYEGGKGARCGGGSHGFGGLTCQNPSRLRCSRCRQAFFCSEDCQRKAWPVHKHECRPRDEANLQAKATQDCPICLEAMVLNRSTASAPVSILECLHVVHTACWQQLIEARGEGLCPVCRDPLAMSR
ncbi:unnamed protein product [Effrenium voratum]|nr:unnamed protein product [Effrenium voratum]